MKQIFTTLLFLFVTLAISAQSKEEVKAQKRTGEVAKVLELNEEDTTKVYDVLLAKEKETTELRSQYKNDEVTFKAELKNLNKKYNRQMKDFLGGENMEKMHAYFKSRNIAKTKS